MHVWKIGMSAATLALAMSVASCMGPPPSIPDEQIEDFRALGEQMVPAATSMHFEQTSTMSKYGPEPTSLTVEVTFANFADLRASVYAVESFGTAMKEETLHFVYTDMVNAAAPGFERELESRLVERVPGLENVRTQSWVPSYVRDGVPYIQLPVYAYVSDESVVDPAWLDAITDIAHLAITDLGGRPDISISVMPIDMWDLGAEGDRLSDSRLDIGDLPGIKQAAAGSDCVRTEAWAYDVFHPSAEVYPADDPSGACL